MLQLEAVYLQDRENKIKNIQRGSIEVIYKEDEGLGRNRR